MERKVDDPETQEPWRETVCECTEGWRRAKAGLARGWGSLPALQAPFTLRTWDMGAWAPGIHVPGEPKGSFVHSFTSSLTQACAEHFMCTRCCSW